MAERNARLITKRTSVPGKIPTGTTGDESGFVRSGELASNLADKKLFGFDGADIFEYGSNSFLGFTGGTISGNVFVSGNLSASTIFSGNTDLYNIFSTTSQNNTLYVFKTGDTMTGTLYAPSISATTISATTYYGLPITTSSNGITKTGENFTLGGTLTGETTITQGINGIHFDTTIPLSAASSWYEKFTIGVTNNEPGAYVKALTVSTSGPNAYAGHFINGTVNTQAQLAGPSYSFYGIGPVFINGGNTILKGTETGSSTSALSVTNSDNTNLFSVRSDGNVGINNSNPLYKLDILGSNAIKSTIGLNYINSDSTGFFRAYNDGHIVSHTDVALGSGADWNYGMYATLTNNEPSAYVAALVASVSGVHGYGAFIGNTTSGTALELATPSESANLTFGGRRTYICNNSWGLTTNDILGIGYGVSLCSPTSQILVLGSTTTDSTYGIFLKDSGSTPNFYVTDAGKAYLKGVLTLGTIGSGAPTINLGLDSSGNVVTGTTGGGTFTGGTVTGNTIFTSGLSSNEFSATTISGGTIFIGSTDVISIFAPIIHSHSQYATLSGATFTGPIISPTLSATSISATTVTVSNLVSTATTIVEATVDGVLSGTGKQFISAYITSGDTAANLLENTSNWDINGAYTGTTITSTYQGQKHYNNNYFFEAVTDNVFIRLIRG